MGNINIWEIDKKQHFLVEILQHLNGRTKKIENLVEETMFEGPDFLEFLKKHKKMSIFLTMFHICGMYP